MLTCIYINYNLDKIKKLRRDRLSEWYVCDLNLAFCIYKTGTFPQGSLWLFKDTAMALKSLALCRLEH